MDCRTFHRKLDDYLQGDLDFAGRFGMERHASRCYACDRELTGAMKIGRMARALKRVGAPAEFEASVMARIQEEKSRRRFRPFWRFWIYGVEAFSWRTLAWGASSLALAGLAFFLYRTGQIPTDAPGSPAEIAGTAQPRPVFWGAVAPAASEFSPAMFSGEAPSYDPQGGPEAFRADFPAGGLQPILVSDSGDGDYVEYLVPGIGQGQIIMRLPKTIRMRYGHPSEEYFIRNVSH